VTLAEPLCGSGGKVIALSGLTGIQFLPRDTNALDTSRGFSSVTFGKLPSAEPERQFTYESINLTPLEPVHIRGKRDGSGDVEIVWTRRTRGTGDYLGRQTAPLLEESEQYEVDVLDGSGSVVRTLSSTSQSVTYTASQQVNDFGSEQSAIDVRVYQISQLVGQGWPASGVV